MIWFISGLFSQVSGLSVPSTATTLAPKSSTMTTSIPTSTPSPDQTFIATIKVLQVWANSRNHQPNDPITFYVFIAKNAGSDSYQQRERVKLTTSDNRHTLSTEQPPYPIYPCQEGVLNQTEIKRNRIDINTKFDYEPGTWTLHFHAKTKYGLFSLGLLSEIYEPEWFTAGSLACFHVDDLDFQIKLVLILPDKKAKVQV